MYCKHKNVQRLLHTHTHTHTHTHAHTHEGGDIDYMQIWRDEFLRLAWKKIPPLYNRTSWLGVNHQLIYLKEDVDAEWRTSYGNEFHCVGPVKEKARCPKVLVFVKGRQKDFVSEMEEFVWMDGTQSRVQKDRLGNFELKNCNTGLRLYTGFLRLLVASDVSEGGVWCVHACELWKQVWLQNFGTLGDCQEDVLENLIEENYNSQV